MNIERPLDFLNSMKRKNVTVRLKDQDELVQGLLLAFDIHLNLVLDTGKLEFIKGDSVKSIC